MNWHISNSKVDWGDGKKKQLFSRLWRCFLVDFSSSFSSLNNISIKTFQVLYIFKRKKTSYKRNLIEATQKKRHEFHGHIGYALFLLRLSGSFPFFSLFV